MHLSIAQPLLRPRTARRGPARAAACALAGALALAVLPAGAQNLPGKGVKVQPLQSSNAEETFQTLLVSRGLQKLGYDVQPIKEIEYATAHVAIANGDATFMADHWDPLHADFYKNAGGDAKLWRKGAYSANAAQGYLIDRKTAEQYKITHIDQLKDPKLAKLFDANGDGRADLTGCNPGWGCEAVIEHQMKDFGLSGTVTHVQGSYAALMADTIARFKQGKPILYYTWTPYWVSGVLRPGQEVVWLQVPRSSLPGEQAGQDTKLPDGKNYGFVLNTQRIVANKAFAEKNPAAARLFEVMQLPVADINAQNLAMKNGQGKQADIERHADGWIRAHQKTFDGWLQQATAAAAAH
ncbi:glycine betaine/L-proline ABC transporter substrate-binding protein ProX [Acidovorax sp. GBBC 3334]|uniref:glycine betaine/L-proline ABC transporter substrate-binding protein ProX n=1 Tax=Acidovorax sp. GBBC 3334 TaxID=2940496 RepID=UPI00230488BC|nr:glycine betaine/L-proline ABC transporter substrate-binding protein ProX [Acidovorax sp. GBBC 3334]MDA8454155.1 glycine betaine/L-proline ABC transporter substrate-binding protein ProX [Acidovorax sp. GBBC 3334]